MNGTPFSRSAVALLVTAAVALFALSVLLHAYDDRPVATGGRSRPGAYSLSAIGHAVLYDTLRRLSRPVVRSAGNTRAMVGSGGTLVVAEPEMYYLSGTDSQKLITVPRLLLVLPKWSGKPDSGHPNWISEVNPRPLSEARRVLNLVAANAEAFRKEWPSAWTKNDIGIAPTGSGVVQLIRSEQLTPIVGDDEGMLVGEVTGPASASRKIWVLADPDILSNAGIGQGDNAAFMVALIDRLHSLNNGNPGAHIVFDETVHGYREAEGSPIKLMFRFPFVIVTVLSVMALALIAWAGGSRFGAPHKTPRVLDFGKRGLIVNGARLLDYSGHQGVTLKRYVRMTIRAAAHGLHAPGDMNEAATAAWLDRVGKARGLTSSCVAILEICDGIDTEKPHSLARLFDSARAIHRWKGELLNGPSERRHDR